jgi:hypothetical protein
MKPITDAMVTGVSSTATENAGCSDRSWSDNRPFTVCDKLTMQFAEFGRVGGRWLGHSF